jgi:signal transduction histidine kinase
LSLRAILTVTMAVLTALAVAAAVSLVLSAHYFHRAAVGLGDAVESVRLTEAVQVDLLAHGQRRVGAAAREPFRSADLEARLRRNIAQIYRFSVSPGETDLIREMETKVHAYLAAVERARAESSAGELRALDEELSAALDAADRVVDVNVRQARDVQERAATWDRWARTVGSATAVALVAGLAAVLLWVRGRALRPIFHIVDAMRRFGAGERTARAREEGPAELLEVSRTFNEMASALERQREAQLAFLAGIGHDLVNPLSALRLNVAIVSPDRPLPRESDVRAVFQRLERQVEKLRRMISDLLDAARVEAGQLSLELHTCELKELVSDVVEHYRQTAPTHPIAVSLPPAPVTVRCDPLRIEQVLTNLVGNAIKYSPAGSPVEVAVVHDDGRATVTVSDQGVGIAPEDRAHVFEPFRRGSRVRGIAGLGLGLAVARRIVEAHGGRIELDTARRAGSAFHVTLPTASEPRT